MKIIVAFAVLIGCCNPVHAADIPAGELADMMIKTKLIAVDWDKQESAFVHDNDPETLEVVFLKSQSVTSSHVSDDGETIFLAPNAADDEMQKLSLQAMAIRWEKRHATQ